jgi:N4-gp56 family major capsid protein
MATTSVGTATILELTDENRTFYELLMLKRAIPNFLHLWFGMEGSVHPVTIVPENKGSTISWNKLSAFTATTTALTEGVTPEPQDLTITATTAAVAEYGAFVRYTRTLAEFGIHKIAAEAADALGEMAGDSLDLITRAILIAQTTTVNFANGRATEATIAAGDYLTFTEIMKMTTTLKTNKAVPAMNGLFPTLLHPYSSYDLYQDATFQAVLSYAKDRGEKNPWMRGYIGQAFGCSFWETPNGYSLANVLSVTVYYTMLLGKGGFGVGGLAAYMPQVIREQGDKNYHTMETVRPLRLIDKPFGSTGTMDPFDRLASIAWYTTFVAKVLNASFYGIIKHDTAL